MLPNAHSSFSLVSELYPPLPPSNPELHHKHGPALSFGTLHIDIVFVMLSPFLSLHICHFPLYEPCMYPSSTYKK